MTQEEKAKAYDEALKMAKYYKKENGSAIISAIFPELKESEDEKIRKILVEAVTQVLQDQYCSNRGVSKEKVVAWLEKQGEQNVADKIKPKFHEGDWVVCGKLFTQITSIENDGYTNSDQGFISFETAKKFHLWTIQDAKDGDVLCTYECDEPKIVFILKGTPKKHYALSYHCYYNIMYPHFASDSEKGCLAPNDEDVKPATKEQRDLLFQKMREASYEWDAEKKELSRCVIDKGKSEIDYCFTKMMNGEKVSPDWSEEDEEFLRRAINAIKDKYPMTANWLKSLKDRIIPSKQE